MATFAELERALAALPATYVVAASPGAAASEADVAAIEAALGWRLPAELRTLYRTIGGLVVEVTAAAWPRPQAIDLPERWQYGFGFLVRFAHPTLPALMVHAEAGALRWLQRTDGVDLLLTADGAVAEATAGARAAVPGDPIEIVLGELARLAAGIERLRAPQ